MLMVLSVAPFASPFPILASVPIAHFSDFSSTECCAVQFDGKCYILRTIKRYGTTEPFPWCCLRLSMSFLSREKRYASFTNLIILSKQAGCHRCRQRHFLFRDLTALQSEVTGQLRQWSRGLRTYVPVLLNKFQPPGLDGRVVRWPQITATGSKRTSVFKLISKKKVKLRSARKERLGFRSIIVSGVSTTGVSFFALFFRPLLQDCLTNFSKHMTIGNIQSIE